MYFVSVMKIFDLYRDKQNIKDRVYQGGVISRLQSIPRKFVWQDQLKNSWNKWYYVRTYNIYIYKWTSTYVETMTVVL